jgi:hypothetical protein
MFLCWKNLQNRLILRRSKFACLPPLVAPVLVHVLTQRHWAVARKIWEFLRCDCPQMTRDDMALAILRGNLLKANKLHGSANGNRTRLAGYHCTVNAGKYLILRSRFLAIW